MTALSVCVVNYNGRDCLASCLDALSASSVPADEVLVVDNASTDGSASLIERADSDARLIRLDDNRGPPAARNRGFDAARGRYVLFVDNDVDVAPACIGHLLDAMHAHAAAVAMPTVCYAHRPDVIQYDGASWHPLGLMILENEGRPLAVPGRRIRTISSVVTACLLVDRQRLKLPDPFDETFFFNYEDHDFGLRCSVSGGRIVSVPAAICYHGSGTKGLSYRPGDGNYAERRVYYLIRNRWLILLKVYRVRTLLALLPALLVYEIFQLAGVTARGWLRQWLAAVTWVLGHGGEIRRRRRTVQASRTADDFGLFADGPLPFTPGLARGRLERAALAIVDRVALGYWKLLKPVVSRRRSGNPY